MSLYKDIAVSVILFHQVMSNSRFELKNGCLSLLAVFINVDNEWMSV